MLNSEQFFMKQHAHDVTDTFRDMDNTETAYFHGV